MKHTVALLVILIALTSASCRQPDGALPASTDDEVANRLYDLSRDLEEIARGNAAEKQGFADDLVVFADPHRTEALEAVRGFAGRLTDVVGPTKLTSQAAQQLARTCWTLVAATELSDRQIKQFQGELGSQLTSLGVPQERVDALVAEVPTLHRAVSTRPRRWYEVL